MDLKQHQIEALEFLDGKPAAGLFFTMGTGKTAIMLEHMRRKQLPGPVLIVCPLSGVNVWESEIEKWHFDFDYCNLTGTYQQRLKKLLEDHMIYIINFEGLRVIDKHLLAKEFKTVINDESHRLANSGTLQTKIAFDLCCRASHKYILTGTPIVKSPVDVWSQFQMIVPGYLGNFYAFQNRHVDFKKISVRIKGGGFREIRKPCRYKYLEELNQKLSMFAIRKTLEECVDLPGKIYKYIPCPLTAKQLKHYTALKTSLATIVNGEQFKLDNAIAVIAKLQQVCQGFIYAGEKVEEFECSKRIMLLDMLKDLVNEKVIIFTWYRYDTQSLQKELTKAGYNVMLYDGTSDDRCRIARTFQESKEPMIFLSNIEKAKESITLTAAHHCIYYGNTWNYASRVQSEARNYRIGQTSKVIYYDFVCPKTIDELVYWSLKYKKDVANKVTGDIKRLAQEIVNQ